MELEKYQSLIDLGEGLLIEFKESKEKLNRDVYESVCAFLNRSGGHLFLGVKNDKTIVGINEKYKEKIKQDFATMINNPTKISPTYYLTVKEFEIDGKIVLYVFVPESSQVHRCNGRIYIRNEDADLDITDNTSLVANLYFNKQNGYTENKIYPYADFNQLDSKWFPKVRRYAQIQKPDHPWGTMSDLELLKSAGLYLKNQNTGEEGLTLAAILIFGSETLIQSVLPHYRTDAILRKENLDRYDDRDDIRVNLLSSYERLMSFISKHLNDKFYLEGDLRISIRDKIFREAVSNLLIHREFSNPFPAKFIIERGRVYIENGNKPHGYGAIDPNSFSPYPKNPTIAKFFKEIGWVDELGSGVRNIYKYNKIYSEADPQFIEGDIFKIIIPLNSASDQASNQASDQASDQALTDVEKLLKYCETPKGIKEIMEYMGYTNRTYFRNNILNPLIKEEKLFLTEPNKPTSPNQKYYSRGNLQTY